MIEKWQNCAERGRFLSDGQEIDTMIIQHGAKGYLVWIINYNGARRWVGITTGRLAGTIDRFGQAKGKGGDSRCVPCRHHGQLHCLMLCSVIVLCRSIHTIKDI